MRIKVFYCLVWSNMDIKKCKVQKNCEWSAAVVKGLVVTLGMSALVSLEGCANNAVKTNNDLAASIPTLSSSSELPSSSISDSISSSSSNDSDNVNEMIEKEEIQKWLGESGISVEDMEDFKRYLELHRDDPVGGLMEND